MYNQCVKLFEKACWMDTHIKEFPGIGRKWAAKMELAFKDKCSVRPYFPVEKSILSSSS